MTQRLSMGRLWRCAICHVRQNVCKVRWVGKSANQCSRCASRHKFADFVKGNPDNAFKVAMTLHTGKMCPVCRFFCLYDQWMTNTNLTQFRCPQCGHQYTRAAQGVAMYVTIAHPLIGRQMCFPSNWPDSVEDPTGWLRELVSVNARAVQMSVGMLTNEDLDAFRLKSMLDLCNLLDQSNFQDLSNVAVPFVSQLLPWRSDIEFVLSP